MTARCGVDNAFAAKSPAPQRIMSVETPVSSRNTNCSASIVSEHSCHTSRAAATSSRSCSVARTVFFVARSQATAGPPDRDLTAGKVQSLLTFGNRRVRMLLDVAGQLLLKLTCHETFPPAVVHEGFQRPGLSKLSHKLAYDRIADIKLIGHVLIGPGALS